MMKTRLTQLAAVLLILSAASAPAATLYVDLNSTNATPPYTNWPTAATNIQVAIDAATDGDQILVTNGVYATGGRRVNSHAITNRVAVTKALTVQSVNGPAVTVIQGSGPIGSNAVRCVYLTYGASLSGFTLANGATRNTGDNSYDRSGGGVWCESTSAMITNCILTANSASIYAGGAYRGMLSNCTLTGNLAPSGGGAYYGALNDCMLVGNFATHYGGGASYSTLNNCTLTDNSADYGGGAYSNTLNNCTLTINSASFFGGAAFWSTLDNCIVYFNNAPIDANYAACTLNYCCTTPLPPTGTGNLSFDPKLASASHLSASSPCRGAGSVAYVSGTDIDGEAWASPPSIGCDEYRTGAVTGPLSVKVEASFTNVAVGFPLALATQIEGRTSASMWDFGDGVVVSNQPCASHAWASSGEYAVVLWAFNESAPSGVSATQTVHVLAQPVHYVALSNASPAAPFSSWSSAATNIQDAVDVAVVGGTVLVSNGVYATGGRVVYGAMTNRVAVTRPLTVQSVNGPAVTIIQGYRVPGTTNGDSAIRCVYLTSGASLSGFTLTNGATRSGGDLYREQSGGGVLCESTNAVITNCTLTGNSAPSFGGGVYYGTLNNCTLNGNSASWDGGGVYCGTLNNCTLTSNSASQGGGGAGGGILNNCTLASNFATNGGGAYSATLSNCTLIGNRAYSDGAGAYYGTLNSCTLNSNRASGNGGGAFNGTLNNCMLNGNWAMYGGGAYAGWLSNCTLNGNAAPYGGGGACGSAMDSCGLINCTLSSNSAVYGSGGGAYDAGLINCTLTGNYATWYGGGASSATLNNCTLVGNSAADAGGGAYFSTLWNCIVHYNAAQWGSNYDSATLSYCCTTPLPTGGTGNFTNAPLFIDPTAGNYRLQSNSPCINAGTNYYAPGSADLDGRPRIVGGTVDIGAYEYQGAGMGEFNGWLWQYGLRTDGSADYADSDGDRMNNWQEWIAGTIPTNASSVLWMQPPSNDVSGVTLNWQSVSGVNYFLQRATDLGAQPAFATIQSNIVGQAGTTSYTDTTATNGGLFFYRVGVQQ
jgi:parallel beta-helix repeat protein